jgi:hypothetical protein
MQSTWACHHRLEMLGNIATLGIGVVVVVVVEKGQTKTLFDRMKLMGIVLESMQG